MNISSSNGAQAVYMPTSIADVTAPAESNSAEPGGQPEHRVHHRHGGGHMHQAMEQALQSLGLSPTQSTAANGSTDASSTGSTNDANDTSVSATGNIKQDEHQLMHALFEAVKGQDGAAATSAASTTSSAAGATQGSGFSSGLASLVTQVSNGSAPSGLQDAFNKLVSDMQSTGAATAANAAASSATLQGFLTQLQQNLGYGATASGSAAGSVVSTQA